MLDQIEGLIKKYAQEAIAGNKEVPAEKTEVVTEAASSTIMDMLKEKASSNDLSSLTSMFSSEEGIKDSASQMADGFIGKLLEQGFNKDSAKSIAMAVLPLILSKFTGKSGGSGGIVMDVLTQLGGKGDLGSLLGGLMGGDKGKDAGGGMLGKFKDLLS